MTQMQIINAIARCQERLTNHDFDKMGCFVVEDLLTKGAITYSLITHHATMIELHARFKDEILGDMICVFKLNYISHELTAAVIAKILKEV